MNPSPTPHPPKAANLGWVLLWAFGVPLPLLLALLVLQDFVKPRRQPAEPKEAFPH